MPRLLTTISWGRQSHRPAVLAILGVSLLAGFAGSRAAAALVTQREGRGTAQDAPPAAPPPLFPLALAWKTDLDKPPTALPGTDAARVYVPTESGVLTALARGDGVKAWSISLATAGVPVSDETRVFIPANEELVALDASRGTELWKRPLGGALAAPFVTREGWLIAALANGEVQARRVTDGATVWQRTLGAPASGPPFIVEDRLYVGLADGRVQATTITDGTVVWERRLGERVVSVIATTDRVYAGSTDNFFYALDARDGRIAWRWRTGADLIGQAAVDDERVYFVSLDTVMRALDRSSGVQRWRTPLPWRPTSGPVLVGDTLVLSGLTPGLRGYATATGKEAGKFEPTAADVLELDALQGPLLYAAGAPPDGVVLAAVTTRGRVYGFKRGTAPAATQK
jgi:outer membrane protein assembly factor BamB